MHVLGDFHVNFVAKDDGTTQASVWFLPAGDGEPFEIGGPYDVAEGTTLSIGPSCTECDLTTSASVGPADTTKAPDTRKQPEQPPARATAASKPGQPPARPTPATPPR